MKKQDKGKGKVSEAFSMLCVHKLLLPVYISLSAKPKERQGEDVKSTHYQSQSDWFVWKWKQWQNFSNSFKAEKESQGQGHHEIAARSEEEEEGKGLDGSFDTLVICEGHTSFRWDSPTTYPDWLLMVPFPWAAQFIVEHIPIVILESMCYHSTIHMINCDLLKNIASQLSAGMKYMMPTKLNLDLIHSAWDNFINCLHWSIHFKIGVSADITDDYDPDFTIKQQSTQTTTPLLDQGFKFSIVQGNRVISQMISDMPSDDFNIGSCTSSMLNLSVFKLHNYLTSHELVVLVTNKNLGCAVCPRAWIIEKTFPILDNPEDYMELPVEGVLAILQKKAKQMLDLSLCAQKFNKSIDFQSQLPDFFTSQLPEDLLKSVPTFYVILL
jgi:hypothetical protein